MHASQGKLENAGSYLKITCGAAGRLHRGVNIPMFTSQGVREDFLPEQKERMAQRERKRRRYQRQLSRRTKGSSGWRKTKRAIARTYTYGHEVRKDFAHQVSHRLLADDSTRLIVFEALQVKNMTRKPKAKAKRDESGR
ncbi:transposase [Craterilacuibacter sp.]|uniref:transposase n=1 Tax=Craterilacuibacter sp. TaxID=2870909 RepID=UPI003F2FE535